MKKFWRDKKVLITGHTGFKGSWLSLWLQHLGAQVVGYALEPPTNPNLFTCARVATAIRNSTIADIRDYQTLFQVIQQEQPEIIIHMAAQPLVRYSYANPVETYTTNVLGTVNLLEAIRHLPSVKVILNVTTDKCYENKERLQGYREDEPMGGNDPYSSSKACAELVTAAYRHSYFHPEQHASHGVALASARAGNVIGGGDWATDRLIPDIVRAFQANERVQVRNPEAVRPWQHVLEPLSGYLLLAQKLYESPQEFVGAWNFGPADEDAQTVEWIVNRIQQLWGGNNPWDLAAKTAQPHEAKYLKLDCSKAKFQLNWQACWNLEQGLQKTVEWFKSYHAGDDMQQVTLHQIAGYMENRNI